MKSESSKPKYRQIKGVGTVRRIGIVTPNLFISGFYGPNHEQNEFTIRHDLAYILNNIKTGLKPPVRTNFIAEDGNVIYMLNAIRLNPKNLKSMKEDGQKHLRFDPSKVIFVYDIGERPPKTKKGLESIDKLKLKVKKDVQFELDNGYSIAGDMNILFRSGLYQHIDDGEFFTLFNARIRAPVQNSSFKKGIDICSFIEPEIVKCLKEDSKTYIRNLFNSNSGTFIIRKKATVGLDDIL